MKKLIAIIALILLGNAATARILNVPGEYPTIQAGIDTSVNGDTVLVAPGVYAESLLVQDKNISLFGAGGPDTSIILGDITFMGTGIDTTCILQGFRIRRNDDHRHLIEIYDASPKIVGCIVFGYWGSVHWGIQMSNSRGIIRANIIKENKTSSYTYGIKADSGYPTLERNIIIGNSAIAGDQGVLAWGVKFDSGILRYNIISGNYAMTFYGWANGGGVFSGGGSDCQIYNNTIAGNGASSNYSNVSGGGLAFSKSVNDQNVIINNNIICSNSETYGVWGNITDSAWTGWDYNLVFNNDSLDYVGFQPGPHDIQADPIFVDRDSGDYHLLPGSPCINAGDPTSPLDPDSTRADIGALFFNQSVDIDNPGEPSGPYAFELHQNYPNPFNGETIISYYMPQQAKVGLRIYDMTGRIIQTLARGEIQAAGGHKHRWDGADTGGRAVSTGIYLYELTVDGQRQAKTLIILK